MTAVQTNIESQIVQLTQEAFDGFCEDFSEMFDVTMECARQEPVSETVKGLEKNFKKLTAVYTIKAEGELSGDFGLILGREGLFTLAGIIVSQPEQKILETGKHGSKKDAEETEDAIRETGNLLVSSWDRVFREQLQTHGHFGQNSTFIGKLKDDPPKAIGLWENEEFTFIPYEMTIEKYPPFNCGVIFPHTIFAGEGQTDEETSEKETQQQTKEEQEPEEKQEPQEKAQRDEPRPSKGRGEEQQPEQKQVSEGKQEIEEKKQAEDKEKKKQTEQQSAEPQKAQESTETAVEEAQPQPSPSEKAPQPADSGDEDISEDQRPKTEDQRSVVLNLSSISAKDIMEKNISWLGAEAPVEQAVTKMQKEDSGYIMVGTKDELEGIVSSADLAGAVSPYLRPAFAKWRRPLDDATLQIKVKWIMSKPVQTVKLDTPLAGIMEEMRGFAGRCVPVMDAQGKIQGIITAFTIFKALLRSAG